MVETVVNEDRQVAERLVNRSMANPARTDRVCCSPPPPAMRGCSTARICSLRVSPEMARANQSTSRIPIPRSPSVGRAAFASTGRRSFTPIARALGSSPSSDTQPTSSRKRSHYFGSQASPGRSYRLFGTTAKQASHQSDTEFHRVRTEFHRVDFWRVAQMTGAPMKAPCAQRRSLTLCITYHANRCDARRISARMPKTH